MNRRSFVTSLSSFVAAIPLLAYVQEKDSVKKTSYPVVNYNAEDTPGETIVDRHGRVYREDLSASGWIEICPYKDYEIPDNSRVGTRYKNGSRFYWNCPEDLDNSKKCRWPHPAGLTAETMTHIKITPPQL